MEWFVAAVERGVSVFFIDNIDYPLAPAAASSSTSSSRSKSTANPSYLVLFMRQYLMDNNHKLKVSNIGGYKIFATCSNTDHVDARLLSPVYAFVARIERPNDQQREKILSCLLYPPDTSVDVGIAPATIDADLLHDLVSQTKGISISDLIKMVRNAYHDSITDPSYIDTDLYARNLITYVPNYDLSSHANAHPSNEEITSAKSREDLVGLESTINQIYNILFTHEKLAALSTSERDYLSALDLPAPSGILIHGPSGCGKTTLASEIARLCRKRYKCLNLACTDLVHKIVGESEQALVRAFQQARSMSPCLLILDNIDIILGTPVDVSEESSSEESLDLSNEQVIDTISTDSTTVPGEKFNHDSDTSRAWLSRKRTQTGAIDRLLSTLLVEMDGLKLLSEEENKEVLVIATATHIRSLDKSLLRPGRLEEHIPLTLPTSAQRYQYLKAKLPAVSETVLEKMSNSTEQFTFAMLKNAITEAGMTVMRGYLTGYREKKDDEMSLLISQMTSSYQESLVQAASEILFKTSST